MRRLVLVVLLLVLWAPAAKAWTWPVQGPVLLGFTFDPAHPYAGGQHRGIDIGAGTGTPVVAPAGGAVTFAGTVPASGKSVTIATPDGYSVTLTHLGSIGVSRGATVGEGDAVGTVGPSGAPELNVPYLYMGVRTTAEAQGYLDPLSFLPALPPPTPSAPTPPPPAGATTGAAAAAPPETQTTGDATGDGSAAESGDTGAPSADETGDSAGSDGATAPAPVQTADSPPAPDAPAAAPPADAGAGSPAETSGTDASAGAGDETAAPGSTADAAASGSSSDASAGAGAGAGDGTAASGSAPDPGGETAAGTGGTPSGEASPPPPPSPPAAAPPPVSAPPRPRSAPAPAAAAPPAIVVTPVVEDVPTDGVEPQPAAAAPEPAPAVGPTPAAASASVPAGVWVDDALVVRAGPLGTVAALVPAVPRAVPWRSRPRPDRRVVPRPPAPRAAHRPSTVQRPARPHPHADADADARNVASPQRRPRRALPARARAPHRSGPPATVLVLLALAALFVGAAVVGGVRMISSPSQPEGERSDAAEDPRRGRVAVCERPEAPRPCGGSRRAVGHLRALPPVARQRRPDGERDGRARHARHGLRRPRGRVSA